MNAKSFFTTVGAGLATLILWEQVIKPRMGSRFDDLPPVPEKPDTESGALPGWWPF